MNDNRGLCIASMVLGITSIMLCSIPFINVIVAVVGLVLGCIGLRSIAGKGFAKAGFVTSIVGIVMGIIITATVLKAVSLFSYSLTPGDKSYYFHYGPEDDEDIPDSIYDLPFGEYYDDFFDGYRDDYQGQPDDEHNKHHDGLI